MLQILQFLLLSNIITVIFFHIRGKLEIHPLSDLEYLLSLRHKHALDCINPRLQFTTPISQTNPDFPIMTATVTQMPSFYHHRNPAKDRDRPNFIFLSDIPHKVTECVSSLHLFLVGTKRKVVNLAASIQSFEITLELNGLLLRNSKLTPSELVRKNLIYVARTKAPLKHPFRSVTQFPEVWQSILAMRTAHETFVVSFSLTVASFTIDMANNNEITLVFEEDASFEALHDCDPLIVLYVENYVRRKLISELNKLADFTLHITNPATILQNLPPVEKTSDLEDVYSSINLDPNQLVDVSLSDIDVSYRIEKQLIFSEDTDFDASDDELRILPSDDSAKGTLHEDDELDRLFSRDSLPCIDLAAILDLDNQENSSRSVLDLMNNVDINELDSQTPEPERLAAPFQELPVSPMVEPIISCQDDSEDELDEVVGDLDLSPVKPHKPIFSSLSGDHASLPKKPSLSFVDHDEKHGLEYAFRNLSPEIPKYIKEDKKFKFIKIGKVQKFVNMFEEHKDEPKKAGESGAGSRVGSRVGTRPASPMK